MSSFIELKEKVFNKLDILYGDKIPDNIIDRVNRELDYIDCNDKGKLLLDLLTINDCLKNNYGGNYIFVGSIDEYYIAYLLGITLVNPIDVDFHISINVHLLIKEGLKDEIVALLNECFDNKIKAVSTTSHEDLPFYHWLVIDNKNQLSTYEKSKIRPSMPYRTKAKKKDLSDKYDIIGISELMIFDIISELDKLNIEYPVFDIYNISKLKESMLECNTLHKTRFEILLSQYDNVEDLFFDNFKLIEKWRIEFYVTWAKYNRSLSYYNIVIKYFNNQLNKNIDIKKIKEYMNDFDRAISYYESKDFLRGEDYYPYNFFKICHDIKNIFDRNFKIDINDVNEIIPIFYNIVFLESHPLNGKMEVLSRLFLNFIEKRSNKIVNIYTLEGPSYWYIANIISHDIKEDRKVIETYLNPLKGTRYILPNKPLDVINNDNFMKSINKLRNSCITLYNLKDNKVLDNFEYLLETLEETDVIIIDNLSSFMINTKYNIDFILKKLNETNKEIYIFDNLRNECINKMGYKRKYTRYIYTMKKYNNIIKLENIPSFRDVYILEVNNESKNY